MKKLFLIIIIPFLSFGQDLCEGVTVEINSLTDSTVSIVISTVNSPDFWCSYCGLVLKDNNDNIVAIENPYNGGSFYGLAGGYSELRILEIINSVVLPFEGVLHAMNGLMPNVIVDENFNVNPLNPIDLVDGDIPFTMCSWEFNLIDDCVDENACNYGDQNPCLYPQNECWWITVGGPGPFIIVPVAYIDEDCECICNNDLNENGICDEDENNTLIEELMNTTQLINTIDILGREANNKGFQLHIYDDGSVEKKYLIK